jgi:hypothetical protein
VSEGSARPVTTRPSHRTGIAAALMGMLSPGSNAGAAGSKHAFYRRQAGKGYRPADWGTSEACAKMVRKNRLAKLGVAGQRR